MEMDQYAAINMKGQFVDPFNAFDPVKMSVPSSLSEHLLSRKDSQLGGVFTPTETGNAVKGDITFSSTSSSDSVGTKLSEEELKQIKRAQNRAAQRAFRERKETRLKELEQELLESERHRKKLDDELEELRKVNLEMSAENRMLLEQGMLGDNGAQGKHYAFPQESDCEHSKSLHETKRYHSNFIQTQGHYYDESGKEVLTINATWDYLHKLSEQMEFNVTAVLDCLKGSEVCHGFGAAYPRSLVDQLAQEQFLKDAGRI